MSVRVHGTITIERKRGRNGEFAVGELTSDLGRFEVKDSSIEEFKPGKYTGDFIIRWIEPDPFLWNGRVFVKVRAFIEEIVIDEVISDDVPAPAHPPVPDPIETPTPRQPHQAVRPSVAPPAPVEDELPEPADADDLQMFGAEIAEAIRLGDPVRLDKSVDRELLRKQRDRLDQMGYDFDAKTQVWTVAAGALAG
jgi:hypothetical protein